jgi:hypothetical protein
MTTSAKRTFVLCLILLVTSIQVLQAESLIGRESFDEGLSGWTSRGAMTLSHDPAGGQTGGALLAIFQHGNPPMPLDGVLEAYSSASGGLFSGDFGRYGDSEIRLAMKFDQRLPAGLMLLLRDGEEIVTHLIPVAGLEINQWHILRVPLSWGDNWFATNEGIFYEVLANVTGLELYFMSGAVGTLTYRLDSVELWDGIEAGGGAGDTGGGDTDNSDTDTDTGDGDSDDTGSSDNDGGDAGAGDSGNGDTESGDGPGADWYPSGGEVLAVLQPTFTWPEINGAEWYQVELKRRGNPYLQRWVFGAAEWEPMEDLARGAYTWRIRGWAESQGYMEWSEERAFIVISDESTGPIRLLWPLGEVYSPDILYRWDGNPQAHWYQVKIEREGAGVWRSVWNSSPSPFTASALVTDHPEGTYRWSVRMWVPGELSEWSEPGTVTIRNRSRP